MRGLKPAWNFPDFHHLLESPEAKECPFKPFYITTVFKAYDKTDVKRYQNTFLKSADPGYCPPPSIPKNTGTKQHQFRFYQGRGIQDGMVFENDRDTGEYLKQFGNPLKDLKAN